MSWRRYGVGILSVVIAVVVYQNWMYVRAIYNQPQLFRDPVFDTQAPVLPQDLGGVAILSFSKTNGYRHLQSIPASIQMLDELAAENGWQFYHTENAAVFTVANLKRFQLVVLNHKSGTVWTDEQRSALKDYVESGGSMIAQHAAGGDQGYDWKWYFDQVLKAQFVDHPMTEHIQPADLIVEEQNHPATAHLPSIWRRSDEWYNFSASPRAATNVLISIDESTYDPEKSPMGEDHPLVWWHKVGEGQVLYSALGHTAGTYQEPQFRQFMRGAIAWGLVEAKPADTGDPRLEENAEPLQD